MSVCVFVSVCACVHEGLCGLFCVLICMCLPSLTWEGKAVTPMGMEDLVVCSSVCVCVCVCVLSCDNLFTL